jgi:predicted HicB family RNase H-like nuclease
MSYLKYKGYLGTIEPDLETGELFGKLAFIRDLITYEAETLKALEQAFQESVDGYLESCAELGKNLISHSKAHLMSVLALNYTVKLF